MAHVSGFTVSDTVAIASGASIAASGLDISDRALVGVILPATWTTADLTFQTSDDNVTFQNLYDENGTEYTLTGSTGARNIAILNGLVIGHRYIKVRSGTSGSAVTQTGARSLTVLTMNL